MKILQKRVHSQKMLTSRNSEKFSHELVCAFEDRTESISLRQMS